MKKTLTITLALTLGIALMIPVAVLAPAALATAQAREGGDVTRYEFEDDLVSGDLVRPDGEMLNVRRRGARSTLIRVRDGFVAKLYRSVENL